MLYTRACSLLFVLVLAAAARAQEKPRFPPPRDVGPVATYGGNVQRTMTLLATGTPERRNTVKVLFYGQSITEQNWWKLVADDLRKRFPNADLVIENRALGGFGSQLLVKTAETDLYPFYPDLVIFHVYGSHIEYENIIRRIRERTTAEIVQQNDHVTQAGELEEETDGAKLTPKNWGPWMNHAFLPSMAKKYHTEFVDQRAVWKRYLTDFKLPPKALLIDGVHLNDRGCTVMAAAVTAHLRYDPKLPDAGWKDWVKTYTIGMEVQPQGGKLTLPFDGNRVDVIFGPGKEYPANVRIDGKKPSEFPELYALTRTTYYPGSGWPCLLRVQSEKPLQLEEWTLTLADVAPDLKQFRFTVAGSKTGPDGAGESGKRFVSKSGRVVIDPADWNFEYALMVFKKPIESGFQVRWNVVPLFKDNVQAPESKESGVERVVTAAQGLPNGRHTLELDARAPIMAIRVYRPPFGAK